MNASSFITERMIGNITAIMSFRLFYRVDNFDGIILYTVDFKQKYQFYNVFFHIITEQPEKIYTNLRKKSLLYFHW